MRIPAEQPRHLLGRLEVTLRVRQPATSEFRDGAVLADACQDVLELAATRMMVVDVVGGHQRHPAAYSHVAQPFEPRRIVTTIEMVCSQIQAAPKAMPGR